MLTGCPVQVTLSFVDATDINRVTKAPTSGPNIRPRILVLAAAPDTPSQYIATMNCIFSAQRAVRRPHVCSMTPPPIIVRTDGHRGLVAAVPTAQSVPVDVCLIGQTPSVFLQQAAYLTEGCYVSVGGVSTLLQALMVLVAATGAHGASVVTHW